MSLRSPPRSSTLAGACGFLNAMCPDFTPDAGQRQGLTMTLPVPDPGNYRFDLNDALSAVVIVQAHVPETAESARRLGSERIGSGCLISAEGLVATVGYLVTDAETVWLVAGNGKASPAEVVGRDTESGIALLRALEPLDSPFLKLGRSGDLHVGERVVIAAAGGLDHAGDARIAARQEFAGYWEYLLDEAIFISPAHPHWAGAALIAGHGGLVGIGSLLVQREAPGSGPSGDCTMVIPIDLLPPVIDDLIRLGRVRRPPRPWVGMQVSEFGENLVVISLTEGGPAQRGDIRVGDVVIGVGGEPVDSLAALFRSIWACGEAGVAIPFDLFRNGEKLAVTVISTERNSDRRQPRFH